MLRLFCFSAQLRPAWRSPNLAQAKPSRNGRCLREAAPLQRLRTAKVRPCSAFRLAPALAYSIASNVT